MTRKEFERLRFAIESEKFRDDFTDPISYGIQRAAFDCEKFRRLIAAAQEVNMQTTRVKMEQWKRQLDRALQSQQRFERLREDVSAPSVAAGVTA